MYKLAAHLVCAPRSPGSPSRPFPASAAPPSAGTALGEAKRLAEKRCWRCHCSGLFASPPQLQAQRPRPCPLWGGSQDVASLGRILHTMVEAGRGHPRGLGEAGPRREMPWNWSPGSQEVCSCPRQPAQLGMGQECPPPSFPFSHGNGAGASAPVGGERRFPPAPLASLPRPGWTPMWRGGQTSAGHTVRCQGGGGAARLGEGLAHAERNGAGAQQPRSPRREVKY